MKLKLPVLNGWMRLYVIVVAIWVGLQTFWLYEALPTRLNDDSLDMKAGFLLSNEMRRIREIANPIDRYRSADELCERSYQKANEQKSNLNKNECLEFMMNGDMGSLTREMVLEVWIRSPFKKDKVKELRAENNEQILLSLKDLLPSFLMRLIGGPLLLLIGGYLVCWVRSGFQPMR